MWNSRPRLFQSKVRPTHHIGAEDSPYKRHFQSFPISAAITAAVAEVAYRRELATKPKPEDIPA